MFEVVTDEAEQLAIASTTAAPVTHFVSDLTSVMMSPRRHCLIGNEYRWRNREDSLGSLSHEGSRQVGPLTDLRGRPPSGVSVDLCRRRDTPCTVRIIDTSQTGTHINGTDRAVGLGTETRVEVLCLPT